jgi:hypothetical protein
MFPAVLQIWIRIDLVIWLFWIRADEIGKNEHFLALI